MPRHEVKIETKEIMVEKIVEVEKIVYKEAIKKDENKNKRKFTKIVEKPDGTKITKEYEKEIINNKEEKNTDLSQDTSKSEESLHSTEKTHTEKTGSNTFTHILLGIVIGLVFGIPTF